MSLLHRVLIVEPDYSTLHRLEDYIIEAGFLAESANTTDEGLVQLRAHSCDVVLVDAAVGGSTLESFLCKVKECDPEIEVLLLAEHSAIAEAAAHDGCAFAYLTKPPQREQVVTSLRHAIEKHELQRLVCLNASHSALTQDQLTMLMSSAAATVIMLDADGHATQCRLFGAGPAADDPLHFTVESFDVRGLFQNSDDAEEMLRSAQAPAEVEAEILLNCNGNSERWHHVTLRPFFDDSEDLAGYIMLCTDIHAQRMAELRAQALKEDMLDSKTFAEDAACIMLWRQAVRDNVDFLSRSASTLCQAFDSSDVVVSLRFCDPEGHLWLKVQHGLRTAQSYSQYTSRISFDLGGPANRSCLLSISHTSVYKTFTREERLLAHEIAKSIPRLLFPWIQDDLSRADRQIRQSRPGAISGCALIENSDHVIEYQNADCLGTFGSHIGEKCWEAFPTSSWVRESCPVDEILSGSAVIRKTHTDSGQFYESLAVPLVNIDGSTSVLQVFVQATAEHCALETLKSCTRQIAEVRRELDAPLFDVLKRTKALLSQNLPPNLRKEMKRLYTEAERAARRLKKLLPISHHLPRHA